MDDPSKNSRYSIAHARRNIAALEKAIVQFHASNAYARVTEVEDEGTTDVHKFKLVKPLPEELSGIAFDVVNSLRSSLDQIGYSIGIAVGTRGKKSHFPFGNTLANVQSLIGRGSKDLPQAIFDFMVAFKPYQGGNNTLWAINALANSQKHETVIPVGTFIAAIHVPFITFPAGAKEFLWPPRWDLEKNEMILARVARGAEANLYGNITTFIAIGKIDVLGTQEIVGFLNDAANMVESMIDAIESEARRLAIFK